MTKSDTDHQQHTRLSSDQLIMIRGLRTVVVVVAAVPPPLDLHPLRRKSEIMHASEPAVVAPCAFWRVTHLLNSLRLMVLLCLPCLVCLPLVYLVHSLLSDAHIDWVLCTNRCDAFERPQAWAVG